jgi:hypothetical protein
MVTIIHCIIFFQKRFVSAAQRLKRAADGSKCNNDRKSNKAKKSNKANTSDKAKKSNKAKKSKTAAAVQKRQQEAVNLDGGQKEPEQTQKEKGPGEAENREQHEQDGGQQREDEVEGVERLIEVEGQEQLVEVEERQEGGNGVDQPRRDTGVEQIGEVEEQQGGGEAVNQLGEVEEQKEVEEQQAQHVEHLGEIEKQLGEVEEPLGEVEEQLGEVEDKENPEEDEKQLEKDEELPVARLVPDKEKVELEQDFADWVKVVRQQQQPELLEGKKEKEMGRQETKEEQMKETAEKVRGQRQKGGEAAAKRKFERAGRGPGATVKKRRTTLIAVGDRINVMWKSSVYKAKVTKERTNAKGKNILGLFIIYHSSINHKQLCNMSHFFQWALNISFQRPNPHLISVQYSARQLYETDL